MQFGGYKYKQDHCHCLLPCCATHARATGRTCGGRRTAASRVAHSSAAAGQRKARLINHQKRTSIHPQPGVNHHLSAESTEQANGPSVGKRTTRTHPTNSGRPAPSVGARLCSGGEKVVLLRADAVAAARRRAAGAEGDNLAIIATAGEEVVVGRDRDTADGRRVSRQAGHHRVVAAERHIPHAHQPIVGARHQHGAGGVAPLGRDSVDVLRDLVVPEPVQFPARPPSVQHNRLAPVPGSLRERGGARPGRKAAGKGRGTAWAEGCGKGEGHGLGGRLRERGGARPGGNGCRRATRQ
eukprot:scaffold3854_cov107-Isochrysis_galbana.AAC.18